MSDNKSLVKVSLHTISVALENHKERIAKLNKDFDEAILKFKDGYEFSWWDKIKGRDKWSSEKLFDYSRDKVGWYRNSCEHLWLHGLLSYEDICVYRGLRGTTKDFLKNVLETDVSEVYLDAPCLSFVSYWTNTDSK
jgi:hypothetical protein